jgi:replicative DNA helicase
VSLIHEPEIEEAVLGCILAGALPSETGPLPPEAFTESRRHVWEAMRAMEDTNSLVDIATLSEVLKTRGRLAEVGGPAALMAMDASVPLAHNLPQYAGILRDRLERRRIVEAATAALQQAANMGAPPARTALNAVQSLTTEAGLGAEEAPDADIAELAAQWDAWVARLERGGPTGLDDGVILATGIGALDKAGDGLPSNLCVFLGLASMGKTALAAEIIWNWLSAGIPGGIIGLEDGTKWLTRRHLSRALGIPVKAVGRTLLHQYQMERYATWMNDTSHMYRQHLRIHRAGGLHASDVLAIVRKWINAGVRWIWIDHGLRINHAQQDVRYDMAIGRTLDTLANLGDRHGVVIAVNWHLNRTSDQEAKPDMKMAKESGYLEANARWMLAAWEQKQKRPGMLLATALKVTEGPRDWTVAIPRDPDHALVLSKGGGLVDFEAEAAEDRQRAEDERRERASRTKGESLFPRRGS